MKEVIIAGLIGLTGTILVPVLTYHFTKKRAKEESIEKEEKLIKEQHEKIKDIESAYKQELKIKELEFNHAIKTMESDHLHELSMIKAEAETEIEKQNEIGTNTAITSIVGDYFQKAMSEPDNPIKKEVEKEAMKKIIENKKR